MKKWLYVSLMICAPAMADRIQWSLRFPAVRAHSSALTGCYGTASYEYILPSIDEVRAHRKGLLARAKAAKLSGFAWTRNDDGKRPGNVFTVDLASGEVYSRPKLSFPSPKGIVYCRCRRDDLLFCSPSGVPVLGSPFFTHADATPPEKVAIWKDDTTGLEWHYRWHPACWPRAAEACASEGMRLPTLSELERAQGRLRETAIGERVRRWGCPVWSADEEGEKKENAWALLLDTAAKSRHPKGSCLTAVCVR